MMKDIVVFRAQCKKTGTIKDFTLEDLYGYEGEVCGIIIENSNNMVISFNSGCGMNGMNPDIEISVLSVNGKPLERND